MEGGIRNAAFAGNILKFCWVWTLCAVFLTGVSRLEAVEAVFQMSWNSNRRFILHQMFARQANTPLGSSRPQTRFRSPSPNPLRTLHQSQQYYLYPHIAEIPSYHHPSVPICRPYPGPRDGNYNYSRSRTSNGRPLVGRMGRRAWAMHDQ